MVPPCVLHARQKNNVQTVVVKVGPVSLLVLDTHQKCWIWNGGGASARVEITSGDHQGQYWIVTTKTACGEVVLADRLRKGLLEIPGSPTVEWVRPLNRRLQRLFGWGDVAATREDVVRAAKAGDLDELRIIMPDANVEDDCEDLSHLPDMFANPRRNLPALLDCAPGAEQGTSAEPWYQHPTQPLPFFVIDQDKVSDGEKVIWLRQELGSSAALTQFAAKYIQLFGSRKVGEIQQKGAVLKLYALYLPDSPEAAWKKEGDMPPRDMVEFQRVWNPEAPNRCQECRKAIRGKPTLRDVYCDSKCRDAGVAVKCTRCTPERKCGFCSMKAVSQGGSKLGEMLRENMQHLKHMRGITGHETREADPSHEPEWKKRRRS